MLSTKNLEKVIELEETLRAEYQKQLDAKSAEIEQGIKKQEDLQATIETQLETITELSSKASANQRVEQLNRELTNRTEKLQEDGADLKKRVKTLQQDLAEARTELKALKQFDPAKMKKNLDASKKKLAEKTTATDLLQKSLNKTKGEKAELQGKVTELEAQLEELQPDLDTEVAEEEAAA